MVPHQRGDCRGYNHSCQEYLLRLDVVAILDFHTSERVFFSHVSPHDTFGLGHQKNLCASGSGSMWFDHIVHVESWLSRLYTTVDHRRCSLRPTRLEISHTCWMKFLSDTGIAIRNIWRKSKQFIYPSLLKWVFRFACDTVGWEWGGLGVIRIIV